MAETEHSAAAAQEPQAERELMVSLRPHGLGFWEFEGTRAQLEAEGVIPAATEWPATGAAREEWKAGRLRFSLRRARPPGLKGPMRLWVNGDWWALRCELIGGPSHHEQRVIDARRALEREAFLASAAGQRAWNEQCRRRCAAERDSAFQVFKTRVPGLVAPKRGRKAKTAQP